MAPEINPITRSMTEPIPATVSPLTLLELIDDAVIVLDASARVVAFSPSAERVFGYIPGEVIGRKVEMLVAEQEVDGLLAHLRGRSAGGGPPARLWIRARRKGGDEFDAEVRIACAEPEVPWTALVVRDESRLRLLEVQLRDERRRLEEIEHLAGLGSWEWDIASNRIVWSGELYRICGVEPQEFDATYEGFLALVHPDDLEGVRAAVEGSLRAGGAFELFHRVVRPDGDERVLCARGEVLMGADGTPARMLGLAQDVTSRHEAERREAALREAQVARRAAESAAARLDFLAHASELLGSSLDYEATLRNVARLAASSVADWCAVDLLDAAGTLRRVAVEHPDPARVEMAWRIHERYPPEPQAPFGVWQVIRTGEIAQLDLTDDALLTAAARDEEHLRLLRGLQLRSALIVPLIARAQTLGVLILVQSESGRAFGADERRLAEDLARRAAVAIDNARLVTELHLRQHQMEEQAAEMEMQAEELQSQAVQLEEALEELEATNRLLEQRTVEAVDANRAKANFLAAMSHELRTPLNAIGGYAELIEMEIHGPVTPEQRQGLSRIQKNQQYLLALINDILNFAKLEAGKVELRTESLGVGGLLSGMEPLIEPQVRAKGLDYETRLDEPGLRVMADADKVQQILLNLLGNAVKFTQPGGRIEIWCEAAAEHVRIHVQDDGRGIPAGRLEDIFDPFVQVARSGGGEHPQGVGLGLAISRDLARAMGGDLAARSVEGEGATFTVTLPRG